MHTIMVFDTDQNNSHLVQQALSDDNYNVIKANSSIEMVRIARSAMPELFILEAPKADEDPALLCQSIRQIPEFEMTPMIVVGHNSDHAALALNAGADDYIRKPVVPRELAARVRAQLRRMAFTETPDLPIVSILPDNHQVFVNEKEITLTRVEFELLNYLCHEPEKWHSTQDLLTNVWQYPNGVGDAALVRNHVRNLRRKLEDNPDRPAIIQSRHGRGYVIKAHIQFGRSPR